MANRAQGVALFLAATALFTTPGALLGGERALFWLRADHVVGKVQRVTEPERYRRGRRSGRGAPSADIAYRVAGEDHLQPMPAQSVTYGPLRVGDQVTVLVDPFDPKRMYPDSALSVFSAPFVMTAIPLFLGLALTGGAAFGPLPGDRRTRS